MIGSGIFLTPGAIAGLLPSPELFLLAWVVGGALSLAGALANAELGAMFPRAGGDYVYLREAFHPAAGFTVGWLSFFAIYAGTIATLAVGFADALAKFVPLSEGGRLGVAIFLTLACSGVNWVGVRWGARANNVTAWAKIAGLLAFAALGPLVGRGDAGRLLPGAGAGEASLAAFGLALSPVLFSYLGWNASVYVASEIREPQRNVPRSLFLGLAICTAVYVLVNAVYLYALPMDVLAGEPNAGEAAARALFGGLSAVAVGLFVLVSILGTTNATVLVGPRIAYAMALDGLFFRGVDRAHATFHTPTLAIAVQAGASLAILLLLRTFPAALDFTIFAIVLATVADVLALFALRRRQPGRSRPYRAWGYPWVPALYVAVNLGIAGALLSGRPFESLAAVAVALSALPFYRWFAARGGLARSRIVQ